MDDLTLTKYIQESKQLVNRINNLKNNKVKALCAINKHQMIWESYEKYIVLEIEKGNREVEEIYTDLIYYYLEISRSLNEIEAAQYERTLPDIDWVKKYKEKN